MQITSFRDMYLSKLQEICSVEEQLSQALECAGKVASNSELQNALANHRQETELQKKRLVALLGSHDSKAEHTDQAMQALLRETEKMMAMLQGDELRDEIATYGTAAALAGQLDLRDDQRVLRQSLKEEKRMDALLTKLAEGEINQTAVAAE
jgi:ferritin-like metal-binding protein YciE